MLSLCSKCFCRWTESDISLFLLSFCLFYALKLTSTQYDRAGCAIVLYRLVLFNTRGAFSLIIYDFRIMLNWPKEKYKGFRLYNVSDILSLYKISQ